MNQAFKTTVIDQFLDRPTASTFTKLQRSIHNESSFDPHSADLYLLRRQLEAGEFEVVLELSEEFFLRWCASPFFHYLRGQAALAIGELDTADLARFLSQKCLELLLKSGDGSYEHPYQITYRTDVADILMALDVEKRHQSIVDGPNGRLDVVTLTDGSEIWFDVEPILSGN